MITHTHESDAYIICTRCVRDSHDPNIQFDAEGVCNSCRKYDTEVKASSLDIAHKEVVFHATIEAIKIAGRGKAYDSILGLSGGLDSSYVAYVAWKAGLRPLIVHLDNGWDSELAIRNIENIVKKTGFDYFNYVIDWNEFRDLQVAYLKASVIDAEIPSDHAVFAILYKMAVRKNLKYIVTGMNNALEAAYFTEDWSYQGKQDKMNLKAIHNRFGTVSLKTYPVFGIHEREFAHVVRHIQTVPILDYVAYDKQSAIQTLECEFGWRDHGRKHCESLYTKFYQAYILPSKFGLDKRRLHLSSLIMSGQLTRDEAQNKLAEPLYADSERSADKEYVLKKLGLSGQEFDEMMKAAPVSHYEFPVEKLSHLTRLAYAALGLITSLCLPEERRKQAWLHFAENFMKIRWLLGARLRRFLGGAK